MVCPMAKVRDPLALRVGAAVRVRRKSTSKSQEALAAEIGISEVTLSNIERGQNVPTLAVFLKLHAALGLDATELAEAQAAVGTVDADRIRLEAEARELVRAIDLRDLKLLVDLARGMRGK